MRLVAVIPARMASSRLPGKPLLAIRGLPIIEHVRRRVLLCERFADVVVATCDREIADVVERNAGKFLMTSPSHAGALDRVAEAVDYLNCTHVVNVQGDQVLVLPEDLDRVATAMIADPQTEAWNGVGRIEEAGALEDPSIVKLFVSRSNRILFCMRRVTGLPISGPWFEPVRMSIGVMGYSRGFLERYQRMARTPLEVAESVDQMRVLEHDETMRAVEFSKWYPEINEPREIELVERYLDEDSRQRAVLAEILSP